MQAVIRNKPASIVSASIIRNCEVSESAFLIIDFQAAIFNFWYLEIFLICRNNYFSKRDIQ